MEQTINWLPTIITGALITIGIYLFVRKVKKMDEIYLTKESHESLCKISHLEFQRYVAKEMKELKEDYLEGKFKGLVETIEKNNR